MIGYCHEIQPDTAACPCQVSGGFRPIGIAAVQMKVPFVGTPAKRVFLYRTDSKLANDDIPLPILLQQKKHVLLLAFKKRYLHHAVFDPGRQRLTLLPRGLPFGSLGRKDKDTERLSVGEVTVST